MLLRGSVVTKSARFLLYFLLIWAPIPLGSNRPIVWVVNGAIATVALLLFAFGEVRNADRHAIDWRPLTLAASLYALVVGFMVLQAMPGMPAEWLHPVWALAPAVSSAAPTISINPSATWATIAEFAPIGFLVVIAARAAVVPRRAEFLLELIVAVTTAVGAYGLAATYFGVRQIFLVDIDAYPGFLTGTFVGTNSAATYFAIGILASSALILTRMEAPLRVRLRTGRLVELIDGIQRSGMLIGANLVLAAALLNTGSRGGLIALVAGLVTLAAIGAYRVGRQNRQVLVGLLLVVAAVLAVGVLSSSRLLGRLGGGLSAGDRVAVYQDTLEMIAARPWLGQGAGTFADAFPLFHVTASSASVWNRAHNSYLQAIAELGLPAAGLLLLAILILLAVVLRRIGDISTARPAGLAVVSATVLLVLQSAVDFSIQMQAVGLTVVVLLGAGVGEALRVVSKVNRPASQARGDRRFGQREVIDVAIPSLPVESPAGRSA